MFIRTFIASIIVSIVLSAIAYLINLSTLLPAAVAYFVVALIAGCATSLWTNKALDKRTQKAQKQTKRNKNVKVLNGGKKETGSVKWFSPSKGFGFITRDNGEDIFVHFRAIMGKGHRVLREGQRVEFAITEGSKGLQADQVSTIK